VETATRKTRPPVDEAGIGLHEVSAGGEFLDDVVAVEDAAHGDEREL
jgi:hypothetical protein